LKAGAAFVPLDFTQPTEYINSMIIDLESKYIATSVFASPVLETVPNARILLINEMLFATLPKSLTCPVTTSFDKAAFIMLTVSFVFYKPWTILNKISQAVLGNQVRS